MGAEFSLADPTPVSSINDNSITESRTDEQHAICDADCDSVEPAQRPSLYPLNNNNNNNSSNNSSNGHTPHLQYVTRFLQMKSAPSLLENQVSYIARLFAPHPHLTLSFLLQLFPDAKELTESFTMLSALQRFCPLPTSPPSPLPPPAPPQ